MERKWKLQNQDRVHIQSGIHFIFSRLTSSRNSAVILRKTEVIDEGTGYLQDPRLLTVEFCF